MGKMLLKRHLVLVEKSLKIRQKIHLIFFPDIIIILFIGTFFGGFLTIENGDWGSFYDGNDT